MPGETAMNRIKCIHTRPSLSLSAAGFTLLLGLMALVPAASANEANLTRFGPETYVLEQGIPTTYSATFRAIDGPAKLVLQDEGIDNAWIETGIESCTLPGVFGNTVLSCSRDLQIKWVMLRRSGKHVFETTCISSRHPFWTIRQDAKWAKS